MGIDAPESAAVPCEKLNKYVDKSFHGKKADRIFMYNPDAIAEWIYKKYPQLMKEVINRTDLEVPFCKMKK